MQTDYFITTNLKPSVSRATLAYAIKTITSIIRPIKTLIIVVIKQIKSHNEIFLKKIIKLKKLRN